MMQWIKVKYYTLARGKYRGQKAMTLGFLFAISGAGVAVIGKQLLLSSAMLLIQLAAKFLMVLGWIIMVFGAVTMLSGIVMVWWSLFSSGPDRKQ